MFKLRYPLIALASALFGAVAAVGIYMYYVPLPKDAMVRGEVLGADADRGWLHGAMMEVFPTRTVEAAPRAAPLPEAAGALEGFRFDHEGERLAIADLHDRQSMLGLVIVKDGVIVHESYAPGHGPGTLFTTWSVVKSFTSTLVGRAVEDGLITSVDDPLDGYLPDLRGTAYAGVTIRQALEMSSGVAFDTGGTADTLDFLTDGPITARKPVFAIATAHERGAEPGTVFNYNTAETQILLELVRRVSGQTAADYMSEALWQPLGMRYNGAWVLDAAGMDGTEIGGALFNAALRDWARLGWFMARDGVWNGERLLPDAWVSQASQPGGPHLMPGEVHPDPELGYGWQWWTRPGGTFQAIGAYGQLIHIDPANGLVVAKASAWPEARDLARSAEVMSMINALAGWDFGNLESASGSTADAGEGADAAGRAAATANGGDRPAATARRADEATPGDAQAEAARVSAAPEQVPAPAETTALPAPSLKPEIDTSGVARSSGPAPGPAGEAPVSETPGAPARPEPPRQAPGEGMGVAESRFLDPEEIGD